jgi:hypothetical protein
MKINKIAVCEKIEGLRSENFSDLNMFESVSSSKIFQFQDIGNESEWHRDAANGLVKK